IGGIDPPFLDPFHDLRRSLGRDDPQPALTTRQRGFDKADGIDLTGRGHQPLQILIPEKPIRQHHGACNPNICRACRKSATGRSYVPHNSTARRTSAAFDGASSSLFSRTLSSSPVLAWPPAEIAHSFTTIWLAPMPAAHQGASTPNRRL